MCGVQQVLHIFLIMLLSYVLVYSELIKLITSNVQIYHVRTVRRQMFWTIIHFQLFSLKQGSWVFPLIMAANLFLYTKQSKDTWDHHMGPRWKQRLIPYPSLLSSWPTTSTCRTTESFTVRSPPLQVQENKCTDMYSCQVVFFTWENKKIIFWASTGDWTLFSLNKSNIDDMHKKRIKRKGCLLELSFEKQRQTQMSDVSSHML